MVDECTASSLAPAFLSFAEDFGMVKLSSSGIILAPNLDSSRLNKTIWRDTNGSMSEFSVKNVWESFRPRGGEDLLRQWDVGVNT
ncbi:hypothetical protein Tco_0223192, partial [Tanacetum coccineum]